MSRVQEASNGTLLRGGVRWPLMHASHMGLPRPKFVLEADLIRVSLCAGGRIRRGPERRGRGLPGRGRVRRARWRAGRGPRRAAGRQIPGLQCARRAPAPPPKTMAVLVAYGRGRVRREQRLRRRGGVRRRQARHGAAPRRTYRSAAGRPARPGAAIFSPLGRGASLALRLQSAWLAAKARRQRRLQRRFRLGWPAPVLLPGARHAFHGLLQCLLTCRERLPAMPSSGRLDDSSATGACCRAGAEPGGRRAQHGLYGQPGGRGAQAHSGHNAQARQVEPCAQM